MLLRSHVRYRMASEIHQEVVNEDYVELQRRHEALKLSEARYRNLTANLEQRVTEQVETIEAAQRQLYQNEKLASVGQLAAGVAHEINNPMGFIKSNLRTAREYVEQLKELTGHLQQAADLEAFRQIWKSGDLDFVLDDFSALLKESDDGAQRVARIVSDLKDFSHVDHAEEEMENINNIIRQVMNVTENQLREQCSIDLDAAELPLLRCQTGQLAQVFYNLLTNAAQAMEHYGHVRFITRHEQGNIIIRVEDNGPGMPVDVREHIFEPFFTTKTVGQGTGLGLTVSHDIIKAHNGHMDVWSEPGKGTCFTLSLPVAR